MSTTPSNADVKPSYAGHNMRLVKYTGKFLNVPSFRYRKKEI